MRSVRLSLSVLLLAATAAAQQVEDCGVVPSVTDLVEPWEETSVSLGAGAIRLALLHGEGEEGTRLLILTLPPVAETGEEPPEEPPPPPDRRCRILAEGGLGFAALDVAGAVAAEDPESATLTVRLPALRFVPESTELEELTLVLGFGVGDDSLVAELEETEAGAEETAP